MAKNHIVIDDVDLGMREIVTQAEEDARNSPYVKVGYLEDSERHEGTDLTMAELASVHEFGTTDGTVPERSFVRSTFDESFEEWTEFTKRLNYLVARGRISTQQAMELLGEKIQKGIQKKIGDGDPAWPELKAETIERKGSSKPLIDTGQMRQSVRYEVVNKS